MQRGTVLRSELQRPSEKCLCLVRLVQIEVTERRAIEQPRVIGCTFECAVEQRLGASGVVEPDVHSGDGLEQCRIRRPYSDSPLGGGKGFGPSPEVQQDLGALEEKGRLLAVLREGARNDVERPPGIRTRLCYLALDEARGHVGARVTQPPRKLFRFLQPAVPDQRA